MIRTTTDLLLRVLVTRTMVPNGRLRCAAVSEEPDNYRQRMINNGLAFAFCILLVAVGVWLATSIAEMRRNQDCVLSGRRNCANVVVPPANPN